MLTRLLAIALLIVLAIPAVGQDDNGNPSIAILRHGPRPNSPITEGAILDVLESYGFISTLENRILEDRRELEGENLTIYWGDAGFDFPSVNLMIEDALDKDVDVLVTLGGTVTQAALQITSLMDTPTPVLFSSTPFRGGVSTELNCIKPAHTAGVTGALSYDFVFAALMMQYPDIERVGAIQSAGSPAGEAGAAEIQKAADALGIKVESATVVTIPDVRLAVESLVDAEVDAIVLTLDSLITTALPIITQVANEVGLPLFYPSFSAIYHGATIGAGASPFYENGINLGRILTAHLNGDVDISRLGVGATGDLHIGVNLDSAQEQGVEISEELMEAAIAVIEDGRPAKLHPGVLAAIARRGVIIPLAQRIDDDRAWLESLHCTDEIIAEQQAAMEG